MEAAPGPGRPAGPACRSARSCLRAWAPPLLLAGLALALTLPGIADGGFRHSDASRHAMDGVFIHDFVREFRHSLANPIDYTLSYYAQYPALGIVLYYPPFFAMVEAVFFALFGISPFSARLTVVFFAVLAALMMYKLLKTMFSPRPAFLATALFLGLPVVVFWSRQTMLEMPAAAMIVTCTYFFYRYVEQGHRRSALWTGLTVVLAVMTKQPALFVLPAFGLYILLRRKWEVFRDWQLYAALALVALVLVPYFYLTFRYAKYLTATLATPGSSGGGAGFVQTLLARVPIVVGGWQTALGDGWRHVLADRAALALGLIVLGASLLSGLVLLVLHVVRPRQPGILLLLAMLLMFLVESVLVGASVGRYAFLILPVLLALPPVLLDRLNLLTRLPAMAAACTVVAILAIVSYAQPVNVMRGHQQAMRELVRQNGGSRLVLFEGYWDGDAVFFTRQADPARHLYLLRGSKMLYTFASFPELGQSISAQSKQEVLDLIRKYGIHAIAVESVDVYANKHTQDDPAVKVRRVLREVLQDEGQFELIARSDIEARPDRDDGAARLNGKQVLVYTVRQSGPARETHLEIPMMGLQLAIRVPLAGGRPEVIDLGGKGEP